MEKVEDGNSDFRINVIVLLKEQKKYIYISWHMWIFAVF